MTRKANILLLGGRKTGAEGTSSTALEKSGYRVTVVHTGNKALGLIEKQAPDLIVFDASTMRTSGSRICRRMRKAVPEIPIIHIRPEGQDEDISAEADVYLQLPFTPRKLLNRVKALLPADEMNEEVVRYGCVVLYRSKRSVEVNGQGENQLTPKLASLLEEFIRHPNQLVTRKQLMQQVWKTDYVGDTRTLDVHIRWMRELIEENPARPLLLKTVRGRGYILKMPVPKAS